MTARVTSRPTVVSHQRSPFPAVRALAGAALFVMLGLTASQDDDGIVLCPFRRCTGGHCPGCGLTRAGGALLRGDVATSWRQHPYLLLAIAQVAAIVAWSTLRGQRATGVARRWQTPLLAVNALGLLGIWVLRMATGAIPTPFS